MSQQLLQFGVPIDAAATAAEYDDAGGAARGGLRGESVNFRCGDTRARAPRIQRILHDAAAKSIRTDECSALSARQRRCRTARAPSAWKLAQAVRRSLEHGVYAYGSRAKQPLAYSVTLTSRAGAEAEIREKLGAWICLIAKCAPEVSILAVLDRQPNTGRWHVHAVVLAPPGFELTKLTDWWRSRWPLKLVHGNRTRPVRKAQHIRPLDPTKLATDLDRTLSHHLGSTRKVNGERIPIPHLPPLHDRVAAYGRLEAVWSRVCAPRGIQVACAYAGRRKGRSSPRKVSTDPVRPPQTWRLGHSCAWCAGALSIGTRRHARYCGRSCGSAESRALRALEKRAGRRAKDVRAEVLLLEKKGWIRRDAIHALATALVTAKATRSPIVEVKIKHAKCRCGAPLARRTDASTCGRGACRSKAFRRRRRAERRAERARIAALSPSVVLVASDSGDADIETATDGAARHVWSRGVSAG